MVEGGAVRTEFGRPRGYLWLGVLLCAASAVPLGWLVAILPRPEMGRLAVIAGVWAVVAGLLVAVIRWVPAYRVAAGVVLLIWTVLAIFAEPTVSAVVVGIGLIAIGGNLVWAWAPAYRLAFDTEGIHVRWRGRDTTFAWADVDSWWVGMPSDPLTRGSHTIQGPVLMLTPAAGVEDPVAGSRRALWVPEPGRWVTTARTDGSPAEIVAALEHLAPDKAGREPGHRITS